MTSVFPLPPQDHRDRRRGLSHEQRSMSEAPGVDKMSRGFSGCKLSLLIMVCGGLLLGLFSTGLAEKSLPGVIPAAPRQRMTANSLMALLDAEPQAVVAGRWQALWFWQEQGSGTTFWDIVQFGLFFSITSWLGETGVGVTAGPIVVWILSNAECRSIFFGIMSPTGDFMQGRMSCTMGSDMGSWEARFGGLTPIFLKDQDHAIAV